MKTRKRGIRGSENKGNEENGYPLGTHIGPSILRWTDPSCLTSFMLVFFSWMLIESWSCHSARLSLFSLCRSQLGLLSFRLPPFCKGTSVHILTLSPLLSPINSYSTLCTCTSTPTPVPIPKVDDLYFQ
jgi:hypothetical protein